MAEKISIISENEYERPCMGKGEDEFTFTARYNEDYSFTIKGNKGCHNCLLPDDCIAEIKQKISEHFDIDIEDIHLQSEDISYL